MTYAPTAKIAEATKSLIDKTLPAQAELQNKLNSLGVSRRHLAELFEKRYGMSPEQHLNQIRFSRAKELLTEGKRITDIAFAVGMANNRNPIPIMIMIPCHRVVGKDNHLVGYAGGIGRKQYLLDLEAAHAK